MGLYNRLVVPRPTPCSNCGSASDLVIQFQFGNIMMNNYAIGDEVKWDGNVRGSHNSGKTEILGYPEPCSHCGFDGDDMYVVEFDGDEIRCFRLAAEEDLALLDW